MKKKIKKSNIKKNGNLVKKSMSFASIINKYPEAAVILMNKGMHCFGCAMASGETLEQGALMHGLDPDKLVEEINRKISGSK
jgi:hybrid cluster-associated redox disulfide protein